MKHIAIAEDVLTSIQKSIDCLKWDGDFKVDIIAGNGYELIQHLHFSRFVPDVFIIDINMPVMDGIATNFYLSQQYPSSKIINLSGYFDYVVIQQAIDSGAHGYLIKYEAETFVHKAIHEVLNGNTYIDSRSDIKANVKINHFTSCITSKSNDLYAFTKREKIFLILNATTLPYEKIAKLMFVELKTIYTYFDRISKKCDVHNRQELTLFSLQNGFAKLAHYVS